MKERERRPTVRELKALYVGLKQQMDYNQRWVEEEVRRLHTLTQAVLEMALRAIAKTNAPTAGFSTEIKLDIEKRREHP